MIVCVCRNVSESEIEQAIDDGLGFDQIVKKFECDQCRMCNFTIDEMCEDARVVER